MANFSSVVVQTPQQSMIPKEMPSSSAMIISPAAATYNEESKGLSSAASSKPPSSSFAVAAGASSTTNGGGLLSGIEMQRQKLQELKRGLNQASCSSSRGSFTTVQASQREQPSKVTEMQ